jgi:hypothetical protein
MADLLKEIRRIHKDGEALRMRALKLAPALRKHVQEHSAQAGQIPEASDCGCGDVDTGDK